jgi:cyanoexosortase A
MSTFFPVQLHRWKEAPLWLVGIAAGLAAINVTLGWRADNSDLVTSSLLFFAAIASSLHEKRDRLTYRSAALPTGLGVLLIAFVLLRSLGKSSNAFLLLSPLVGGVGVALLGAGFYGLRQFRQELLILFFLGVPKAIVPLLVDPTAATANFSALMLWYLGFQVRQDGLNIYLPTGAVEVYQRCSGIEGIAHLLSLSGLFLMMFPVGWGLRVALPILAAVIAFVVNGLRVALMAYLVAAGQPEAFDYWHDGTGSLIFSIIAVLLFGAIAFLLLRLSETSEDDDGQEWEFQEGEEA